MKKIILLATTLLLACSHNELTDSPESKDLLKIDLFVYAKDSNDIQNILSSASLANKKLSPHNAYIRDVRVVFLPDELDESDSFRNFIFNFTDVYSSKGGVNIFYSDNVPKHGKTIFLEPYEEQKAFMKHQTCTKFIVLSSKEKNDYSLVHHLGHFYGLEHAVMNNRSNIMNKTDSFSEDAEFTEAQAKILVDNAMKYEIFCRVGIEDARNHQ